MDMHYVFSNAPQRIYWETTRACDLACRHCRAEAETRRAAGELDTEEAKRVIDCIAAVDPPKPHLVLTGGDPLKRADLLEIVSHAVAARVGVSVSPAVTPLLTRQRLHELKEAGVDAISLSLDGSNAERHDGLRRVAGTFVRTLQAARDAVEAGLVVQVNTLVTASTLEDIPAIDATVTELGVQRWSLFFLITVGRGRELEPITPEQCETLFAWVRSRAGRSGGPVITTTEAPHYRRGLVEQMRREAPGKLEIARHPSARGFGIRDGNGVMFISFRGDITPSGFLPLIAGNVRVDDPIAVYRSSPLFVALRDPTRFEGKCGRCQYREICGGSRARAFAATGNPLESDPLCAYEPPPRAG